ncbi:MAG: TIGR03087 family PEP-CTERM/XrtA system glycosyltransferase [Desulfobulbus sp.]|jgi:sugar transferase (PEP-CTERM/EpsH1 system associated)
MNILYIAHRIPYPPNKGDKIRAFHEVQALAQGNNLFLCALVDDPADWPHEKRLRELCTDVFLVGLHPRRKKILSLLGLLTGMPMSVFYFHEKKLQKAVDALLATHDFDAVVCFSGTSAEYIFRSPLMECCGKNLCSRPRLLMDFCDVDSAKWKEYAHRASFPLSLLYRLEGWLLARYERRVAHFFDHSILISAQEQQLFARTVCNPGTLAVIGNGVDLDYFSPSPAEENVDREAPELLFVGAMDYQANVDGICWFVETVWPGIGERFPNAVLTIVGRNPSREVVALQKGRNIRVTGTVEDVRPFYRRAALVVVPLRVARGIQNKVLEAMAMAKPTVVSRNAFIGIEAEPGQDLLVADSAEDFLAHTIHVLEDCAYGARLARNARRRMEERYAWSGAMVALRDMAAGREG